MFSWHKWEERGESWEERREFRFQFFNLTQQLPEKRRRSKQRGWGILITDDTAQ